MFKQVQGRLGWVIFLVSIAFQLTGCGGFVRSRFPDPNASQVPQDEIIEEVSDSNEVKPAGGLNPVDDLGIQGDEVVEPGADVPLQDSVENARVLEWGIWSADTEDRTRPSTQPKMQLLQFADRSPWKTLSEGNETSALGVIALRSQNFQKPEADPLHPDEDGAKPLYLVISGIFSGQTVTGATFELEVRDHFNQPVILREPRMARQDPETQRWFTPLSAILGDQPQQWVQPGHLFRVHWNLEVGHRERFRVTTSFRLRLPPPYVIRNRTQGFHQKMHLGLGDTHRTARIIHEEQWRNPSQRPAEFWFKLEGEALGEWHHVVRRTPELKHPNSPEIRWKLQDLQAVARFEVGDVEVSGAVLLGKAQTESNQAWVRVLAGAGQEFTIRWKAKTVGASFSSGQVLDRRKPRELTWGKWMIGGCGIGGECDRLERRKVRTTESWTPVASKLFGQIRVSVQILDELSPREVDRASADRSFVQVSLQELESVDRTRLLIDESQAGASPVVSGWPVWDGRDGAPNAG
jgi:hypothetical protein